MTTIKSEHRILAKHTDHSKEVEPERAYSQMSGGGLSEDITSIWNEAHAFYLILRQKYSNDSTEIGNFDIAWSIWNDNKPSPNDPDALKYANRALVFYKRAINSSTTQRTDLSSLTKGIMTAYWAIGADMASLASNIEATRPTTSNLVPEAAIRTKIELNLHLDYVEAGLAKIMAGIKAIRSAAS